MMLPATTPPAKVSGPKKKKKKPSIPPATPAKVSKTKYGNLKPAEAYVELLPHQHRLPEQAYLPLTKMLAWQCPATIGKERFTVIAFGHSAEDAADQCTRSDCFREDSKWWFQPLGHSFSVADIDVKGRVQLVWYEGRTDTRPAVHEYIGGVLTVKREPTGEQSLDRKME